MIFYFCVVDIYFLSKFSFWRHSWRAFECVLGYISIPRCSIVNIYTLDFSLLGSGMGKTHEQYVVFCFQCIHCCFNLPCGGECGSSGNAGQGAYGTNLSRNNRRLDRFLPMFFQGMRMLAISLATPVPQVWLVIKIGG